MALTDAFSYRLGDDGIVLNPDALVTPFVDITTIRGFDSAPLRTTSRDHEGTDGSFMDAVYEKGRPLFLEGMAYADSGSVETFLDDLKGNWAPSRTLVPLYFKLPGVEERVFFVKPLGCRYDVNAMRRVGCTDIQFEAFAEDPRAYTSTLFNVNIPQAAISITGRGYDKGYSYGYGEVDIGQDQVNLVVGGNRPTPPILTITGPALQPRIINDTLGITMQLDINVLAGETLVIDMQYHTIMLNGSVSRRSALVNPTWFYLQVGDNFLRYRTAVQGATPLNIIYRHAWR